MIITGELLYKTEYEMIPNKDKRIKELEDFFKSIELPKELRLNKSTYTDDLPKMIQTHLTVVKNQNKLVYLPYLERLELVKDILTPKTSHL